MVAPPPRSSRSAPSWAARALGSVGLGTRLVLLVGAAGTSVMLMRPELVLPSAPTTVAHDEEYVPAMSEFFWNARAADIDEIEVQRTDRQLVRLRRLDDQWRVLHSDQWLALGRDRAARLLHTPEGRDEIAGADGAPGLTGHFQGANPANHDRSFSIGDAMGTRVRFLSGGEVVADLVLGRTIARPQGPATFVRRHGAHEVYLVEGDLRDNFAAQTSEDWLLGRVFAGLDCDTIRSINVEWNEGPTAVAYSLQRNRDGEWSVLAQGQRHRARPSMIDGALATIEAMRSLGTNNDSTGAPDRIIARIAISTTDGDQPRLLLLGMPSADAPSLHPATTDASPHPFRVLRPVVLLRNGEEFIETRHVAQAGENRLAQP